MWPHWKTDQYRKCQARGSPTTLVGCEWTVASCPDCHLQLKMNHPNQDPPLHIWALYQTWQIDYIGPLRMSNARRYILVGVEVVSSSKHATTTTAASGECRVPVLKEWFSTFHYPE